MRFLYVDRPWTELWCCSVFTVFARQEELVSPCSEPPLLLWTFIDLQTNVQLDFELWNFIYQWFRQVNKWINWILFPFCHSVSEMAHAGKRLYCVNNKMSSMCYDYIGQMIYYEKRISFWFWSRSVHQSVFQIKPKKAESYVSYNKKYKNKVSVVWEKKLWQIKLRTR